MEIPDELTAIPIRRDSLRRDGDLTLFINEYQRELVRFVNYSIFSRVVSLFGVVTNVINLVIFYRQGLSSTINISFFALALSDLCGSFLQLLFHFYHNPLFDDLHKHVNFPDVQYITIGVVRAIFSRITVLITVYIAAERCLCMAFPLHIKQIITTKRTSIVIMFIYITTLGSTVPIYTDKYLGWKFYPVWNKTRKGIVLYSENQTATAISYFFHSFCVLLSFLAILVLTTILMSHLREKSAFLKTVNVQQDKSESLSKRDRTTMFMIVLIDSILIVCYTPTTLLSLITVGEPGFKPEGKYYNWYYSMWSFANLFESINSSVNIFLYHKMSSKYRQAFHEMFPCFCNKLVDTELSASSKK